MTQALNVTGNNIANVNTPGYNQQNAILQVNTPNTAVGEANGTGVKLAYVQRQYDSYLQNQILLEQQNNGRQSELQATYTQIESAMNDQVGSGLSASITSFFNAWQDLSTNPETPEQRATVISDGKNILSQAAQIESQYDKIGQSIDKSVPDTVKQINTLANQINYYNTAVAQAQSGTAQQANDLLDQRQNALSELAKLVNFSTVDDKSGAVTVIVGEQNLVGIGNIVNPLSMQKQTDGKIQLSMNGQDITSKITGGSLGADVEIKNSAKAVFPPLWQV